ncbi:MAG: tail fiber protein, partial [Pseudolabrys sp.]
YIAQVVLFPYTFAPRGWAFCEGQLLAIAQNQALFSIIGTTYGGNGTQNFALPSLSGRSAISSGQGTNLSNYALGQAVGNDNVTLTVGQMAGHSHQAFSGNLSDITKVQAAPVAGGWMYKSEKSGHMFSDIASPQQQLNQSALMAAGGNQPHPNDQPFLGLHYCIALEGVFPTRN